MGRVPGTGWGSEGWKLLGSGLGLGKLGLGRPGSWKLGLELELNWGSEWLDIVG